MKIAFALIAHQHPKMVERLIRSIIREGHFVAVHYDVRAPESGVLAIKEAFAANDSVRIVRQFHVRWGQWSIVAATLRCLEEIAAAGWEPAYVHLMSGADYPIRPIGDFAAFLDRNRGQQFLECVPSNERRWVRGGMQQERYLYRFYFNWREQRGLFDFSFNLQRTFRLKRKFVRGFEPYMGSQWWTLTWDVLKQIIPLARERDILGFFRTTLIPDELFFQTMVANLVDFQSITGRNLTLYQFTDYGVPVVYYGDHIDYLLNQPFFFARKLSPNSTELQDRLDEAWQGGASRPRRPMPDNFFGRIGTEYEDYRISHRNGMPGRPVVGIVPNRWLEDLGSLNRPYFCVLGTSTAELRLIQRVLASEPELLCHGQLFHSEKSEFAGGVDNYAGYDAKSGEIIHVSAPNFVSDLVRSDPKRNTGFLLRWGQGWHIHEIMFDRPNARVAVLRGDPLLAFIETLTPVHPLVAQAFDTSVLFDLPPDALVHRFRQFVEPFCSFNWKINDLMRKHAGAKPKNWASYIDLGAVQGSRRALVRRKSAEGHGPQEDAAMVHWRGWMTQLGRCFDVDFLESGADWSDIIQEFRDLKEARDVIENRLIACGLNRAALASLTAGCQDSKIVLGLV